jgi:hypothetical protein
MGIWTCVSCVALGHENLVALPPSPPSSLVTYFHKGVELSLGLFSSSL